MEWRTNRADVTCDTLAPRPITGITDIRLPGFLFLRILLWCGIFAAFPLSVTAARLSFNLEVHGRSIPAALPAKRSMPLSERVLLRLETAERQEFDPWLRDDIRIAWIAVLEAGRGNPQPHIDATYRVLGLHPDKVWQAILDRRAALLGTKNPINTDAPGTGRLVDEEPFADGTSSLPAYESPKKPCTPERNPRRRKAA